MYDGGEAEGAYKADRQATNDKQRHSGNEGRQTRRGAHLAQQACSEGDSRTLYRPLLQWMYRYLPSTAMEACEHDMMSSMLTELTLDDVSGTDTFELTNAASSDSCSDS